MQLKAIVATALLPLLALADDTTLTSTLTMTKYVTIARVATASVFPSTNATSTIPLGTVTSIPTTTTGAASLTTSPAVSPTIDNSDKGSGAGALSAFGLAGVAGMVVAALM
ncbi:hypothetical protein F4802DRAFT_598701 [Xylaria palmicola]|nr:hypothetical protein F4802DRAFT_598701 [Xylaria palmicola]